MEIPKGFPPLAIPDDNIYTSERWELGKKMFYDPIMSIDSSISCGSCHKASFGFGDNISITDGVFGRPGSRNVPTLSNIGYHPYYTREGGVSSLEMQVLIPIQEHNEFNSNIVAIADKMKSINEYVEMSEKAYQRAPDSYVIARALSNFERSLISGNSHYDRYFYHNEEESISSEAKKGADLFYSEELGCANCHGGFNFANYQFENNGLYEKYEDQGRFRLTNIDSDIGKFKVASLRNIGLTAPYMFDGSLSTLEEVIQHYASGGYPHVNKSEFLKGFEISAEEQAQLIAFLHSLTDRSFVENPVFQP